MSARARTLRVLTAAALVGGALTGAGPAPAASCQSWGSLPPPVGDEQSALDDVDVLSTCRAWAVGTYYDAGMPRTLIERWNGTAWSVVTSPNPGAVSNGLLGVAALSATNVWAVGQQYDGAVERPLILHWNGQTWKVVPAPKTGDSQLHAIDARTSNDVWAAGSREVDGVRATLIEHWNGSKWKVVPSPNRGALDNYLNGVSAASAGDAWAVGEYNDADADRRHTLTMHWNGSAWKLRASPNHDVDRTNALNDVVALSPSNAWAVGNVIPSIGNDYYGLILHWNGTAWKKVAHPEPGEGHNLRGVAATTAGNAWAVGETCDAGVCTALVLRWNGSSWRVQPTPEQEGADTTLLWGVDASSATDAWAVGYFRTDLVRPFAVHCC